MTTGLITQFNPISELTNVVNSKSNSSSSNFSDVLKSTTNSKNDESKVEVKESESNKVASTEDKKPIQKNDSVKDKVVKNNSSKKSEEIDTEEIDEAVNQAAAELLTVVAEVLDVLPEEIEVALDELGIEETALLDPTVIPDVVVELTEAEDVLDITTDENLFENVKEITAKVNETIDNLKELGIDENIIKTVVENAKTSDAEEDVQIVTDETEDVTLVQVETKNVKTSRADENSKDNSGAENQMNFGESIVEQIKNAATGKTENVEQPFTTSLENIYEQVSESIKVNLNEEVTEMEMNLHPASLGNVKIQVAAKDGIITANFTTQNEQVKAAIEAQIVELKENMNEQGIKVEAIEVTVASHAFEENLSEKGGQANEETENKRKRRSINLNDLSENDDIEVEDEIRIAREMMMKNGTTVDYLA